MMNCPRSLITLLFLCTLHISGKAVQGEDRSHIPTDQPSNDVLVISPDTWDPYSSIELWTLPWRYHAGDSLAWAAANFPDSSWQRVFSNLRAEQFQSSAWTGLGWFRLHILIKEDLKRLTLGLRGGHAGKIHIYWDGALVSDSVRYRVPISIAVDRPGPHLLAVRLEVEDIASLHAIGSSGGFFLWLEDFYGAIDMQMRQRSEQMFFTAFLLAFAILHLMLFLYNPSAKSNLYYTIFLILTSATVYVDIEQAYLTTGYELAESLLVVHRALVPLTSIFFLRFLYAVFYPVIPKQFWAFTGLMLVVGGLIVSAPTERYDYYVYASTLVTVEMVRVVILATRRKKPGAWTFAIGLMFVGIFSAYDTVLDLGIMAPIAHITNAYYFGFFGMMIALSVHLARDFALTSNKLVEQMKRTQEEELARRIVEVDNARKTRELDDARQLQLSMLPSWSNDIPGFDVTFHMRTATEVGGDYYDYRRQEDGSLIIAIGDATGHGMRAGTMVSIVKGLFVTQRSFADLPAFLQTCSNAIRQMHLGNLYMGLTLARLHGANVSITTAGMPPVLIHRKGADAVEEVLIKSMPMGGPHSGRYEERSTTIAPGDSLLFMSDGLAESFNAQREMLDYMRVKETLARHAHESSAEIVQNLDRMAMAWKGSGEQTDDITLVVVRIPE